MPRTVTERRPWTREELLLAIHLYWRIPFGQQNATNAAVIELARRMDRTPGSVAMKLNNLTSLDPEEAARGVKGLSGASKLDRQIWDEFTADRDRLAPESEALWQERVEAPPAVRETERQATRTERLGQDFFRRVVLANFGGRCALTGIAHPSLLTASHIVGWAEDREHRLDGRNGIALNKLHDGAFDRALVTFDEKLRLVIGSNLRETMTKDALSDGFTAFEGEALRSATRFTIDPALLDRHRERFARVNG